MDPGRVRAGPATDPRRTVIADAVPAVPYRDPDHSSLFAVDVVGYGALTNPGQLDVRARLYPILSAAFDAGGAPWEDCRHEDRGDGVLVLVPAHVSKRPLVDGVLSRLITAVSAQRPGAAGSFRLKIAVHAGEVHQDANGLAGFDLSMDGAIVSAGDVTVGKPGRKR